MKLPIGQSDFREIIDEKMDFVDKSLFIKEIIDDNAKAILITRPRRFGKTLNLSMLHYFFSSQVNGVSTKGLFDRLMIANEDQQYIQQQGNTQSLLSLLKMLRMEVLTQLMPI